jgi:hypothetical protein
MNRGRWRRMVGRRMKRRREGEEVGGGGEEEEEVSLGVIRKGADNQ